MFDLWFGLINWGCFINLRSVCEERCQVAWIVEGFRVSGSFFF